MEFIFILIVISCIFMTLHLGLQEVKKETERRLSGTNDDDEPATKS